MIIPITGYSNNNEITLIACLMRLLKTYYEKMYWNFFFTILRRNDMNI